MENLIFSLNATMPIFLLVLLGMFLHKIKLIDDGFAAKLTKLVYMAGLPALLFSGMSSTDFSALWDGRFVLFCFGITLISILLVTGLSFFMRKNKDLRGEFIQASYRSSVALVGVALIQNIYGGAEVAPLMIIASVPLYNIMAVVVLTVFKPDREKTGGSLFAETLKGIATNPMILSILAGLLWSLLGLRLPVVVERAVSTLAGMATPAGFLAMGASFKLKSPGAIRAGILSASTIKLIILAAAFLPLAVLAGLRDEKLVAVLVMLGSAGTVGSYSLVKGMDMDGSLTAGSIMLTTVASSFTLSGFLYVLRTLALI